MLSVSSSYTKITEIEVLCVWVIAHCCCNTCSDYKGPAVLTLHVSLFNCCLKTDSVANCLRER